MSREACCHEPDGPLLTSHQCILNPKHSSKTLPPGVLWCLSSPQQQLLLRVQLPRSIPWLVVSRSAALVELEPAAWVPYLQLAPGCLAVPPSSSHRGSAGRPPQPLYTAPPNCPRPLSPGGEAPSSLAGLSLSWLPGGKPPLTPCQAEGHLAKLEQAN